MKQTKNKIQDDPSIGRLISIIHRYGGTYFHAALAPFNLGHGQVPVLMHIFKNEGINQHEISRYFRLDKGSTSSLIRNLENNGFVNRLQHPDDKRSSQLFITDKTREVMPEIRRIFKKWTAILLERFKKEERDLAFNILEKMMENAQAFLEEERKK